MEAQLKGAVLIALVVVPEWQCPILKPLSAKLPPKSETAPHPGWQDGTILQPGGLVNGDGYRHLYLLSSLLRTRILMIHMVFWEVLASLVPLRLPKPVCLPFLRASSFLRTRDLLLS